MSVPSLIPLPPSRGNGGNDQSGGPSFPPPNITTYMDGVSTLDGVLGVGK